jgi:glycosyltransferase involved in cell wall biosynthesis
MSHAPLISVCIPTFNEERYIRESVASVLAQSEQNFELLIIDNCSTDRTPNICREFCDPRIRILQNSRNIGSIENFNKCIQNAIGELIILLPADDLLERDGLELLSRALIENPSVGIAFGSSIQIDHRGKNIGATLVVQQTGILDSENAIKMIANKFNPIQHPMVRSTVFSQVGTFNGRLGCFTDIHLWSRALFLGWDAYVVSKPLTAIRRHENQGQILFRQNTKANLKTLSSHYGQPLTSGFYKENHFNLLFLRFVRFFNCNARSLSSAPNDLENVMISNLVRSHLSNVLHSARQLNLSSFTAEMALSMRLLKLYGLGRILKLYVSVVTARLRKTFAFVDIMSLGP